MPRQELGAEKIAQNVEQDEVSEINVKRNSEFSSSRDSVDDENDFEERGHRGVQRIVAVNKVLSSYCEINLFGQQFHLLKALLLFFLFLQGYGSGLDGGLTSTLQQAIISILGYNGDTAAVNTVKHTIASAIYMPYARLSDRFGRVESWLGALLPFTVGRILVAAAPNFSTLFAGVAIGELGWAGFSFLSKALLSDVTLLKDHTFAMNIYELPEIINFWAAGYISQSLIGNKAADYQNHEVGARWGIGMFAIVTPFTTGLLVSVYLFAQLIAHRREYLPKICLVTPGRSVRRTIYDFIQDLDLLGVLLFASGMVLLLLPLSLAGGEDSEWNMGYNIAMICVGGGLIPVWIVWEVYFAKAPLIPRRYFGSTFVAGCILDFLTRFATQVVSAQAKTNLLIGYDESTRQAQWIDSIATFEAAIVNAVVGVALHYWPRPKFFLMMGGFVFVLGTGLLVKYNNSYFNSDGIQGYIAAEVVMGIGSSLMRYPTWTLVQASVPHEEMAAAIACMLSCYQIGHAVGSCVGSAVWENLVSRNLQKYVGSLPAQNVEGKTIPAKKLATMIFKSPNKYAAMFPIGSKVRDAVLKSYQKPEFYSAIISVSSAALLLFFTFLPFPYDIRTDGETISEEKRREEESKFSDNRDAWILRYISF